MNRELDDQVARHLFGWQVEGHVDPVYVMPDGKRVNSWAIPSFSSDWRGMQLVVEAMTARGWAIMIESNASGFLVPWTCLFASRRGRKSAIGTSAPEAVARAALAALGVPLPQETTP